MVDQAVFPIISVHNGKRRPDLDFTIPWRVIEPHEQQARKNHQQTLSELAARGGLAAREALAVLEDRPFGDCITDAEAAALVRGLVAQS